MKRLMQLLVVSSFVAAGCHHPDEVVLPPDPGADPQMTVTAISPADTASGAGQLDSSAVLPSDQSRFGGYLSLNRVVDDFAIAGVRLTRTREFAKAVVTDRSQPVKLGPIVFGFQGMRMTGISVDGYPLAEIPHTVAVPTVGNVAAGYEYAVNMAGKFQPDRVYHWIVRAGMGMPDTLDIRTPPALSVQSPVGGQRISRTQPLDIRWTGSGKILIVVSEYFPLVRKARPLLIVQPVDNLGHLIVRPRVMALLPAQHQMYVLTFVLYNREEGAKLGGYQEGVLVQASSVYNTYVELQ